MRLIPVLLLSLYCFANTLQGNAAGIPETKAANEYRAAKQTLTNDGFNDYYAGTVLENSVNPHSFLKDHSYFFPGNTGKNTRIYILNDPLQTARLFYSGSHAKTFRCKLIFPQHYYW
jgi:hypothetical protein